MFYFSVELSPSRFKLFLSAFLQTVHAHKTERGLSTRPSQPNSTEAALGWFVNFLQVVCIFAAWNILLPNGLPFIPEQYQTDLLGNFMRTQLNGQAQYNVEQDLKVDKFAVSTKKAKITDDLD